MPIQDWRRLRSQLNQRQFGANEEQPQTEGSWLEGWDPDMPNAREEYLRRWDERYLPKVVGDAGMTEYIRNISSAPSESIADTMTPEQILATGYGQSKYDTNQPFSNWIQNPIDYRANAQSAASKFWNGTAKMVPYAVTTFLDDTAGLVAGLLNVGADAVNGGEFHPLKSFVDNPFSNWMQQARDWSEKVLPNYRTTEEMESQDRWWEHLNANFWGDTFIKNLGFTIGSAGSFLLYGGLAKKAMGTVANKAYKAAVAAAVDGDAAAEAAFQKVLQGAAMGTPENLPNIFSKLSNTYKNMKATTNMFAGVASAIGESRVEALQAAKEHKDEWNVRLSQQYEKDREALEADINAKYSVDELEYDGFGNVVGKRKVLSSEGEAALAEGYRKLQEKYQADMAAVENEATTLANYTFGLNMPILTASNIVMFGRTLSGGFDSQLKKIVKGTFGNYEGKGSKALLGTAYALKNTATEGMEEMSQRIISDSMKNIASNNAAAFHNMKYDTQAIKGVSEWLSSVFDSTKETLRDPTAWEEFAVGALTGALGMPSRFGFRNWSGGILGGIQEANEQVERSRDLAKRMNDTVKDEKFQRALQSAFRQENLNNIQNVALNSKIDGKDEVYKDKDGNPVGPKFVWKTADDAKLLDSVMLWADAGRLQDLENYAESFANMDSDEFQKLKTEFLDKDDSFNAMSEDDQKRWVAERANDLKRTIKQYRDIYNSIDFLSFGTSSKEAIEELVYTSAQLQNFEGRYNKLLDEVISKVRPTLEGIAAEKKVDGSPTERAQKAQNMLDKENELRTLFGGVAADIQDTVNSTRPTLDSLYAKMVDDSAQAKVLSDLEELGVFVGDKSDSLKQDVKDLQTLVRSRQTFYAKLFDPKNRAKFGENFEKEAKTPESTADEITKSARKKVVDDNLATLRSATSLSDYVTKLGSIDVADPETEAMLWDEIENDPVLSTYDKSVKDAVEFKDSIKLAADVGANSEDPAVAVGNDTLSEAVDKLDIEEILKNKADDEDVDIAIGRAALEAVKDDKAAVEALRTIMQNKLADKAQAAGLGTVPGTGEGEGEGTGTGEGGSGNGAGSVTQFEHVNEVLDHITDRNDTTLTAILNADFSKYPELTEQERFDLMAKAKAVYDRLSKRYGTSATSDDPDPEPDEDEKPDPVKAMLHKAFVQQDTGSVRGKVVDVYDIPSAKRGIRKRYQRSGNPGVDATISWKIKHNVQRFIDSGALAKLNEAYGSKLPVYFLGNPHLVDDNLANNPFVTAYPDHPEFKNRQTNVVLAVEIKDEDRYGDNAVLGKYEEAGMFTDDTLITIGDKKYQVIGELWNPTERDLSKAPKDEKDAYINVKDESNKIWNYAIRDSILPQYSSEVEKAGEESFGNEGKWYVAKYHPTVDTQGDEEHAPDWTTGERLYTTLNYIGTGRNETRASEGKGYEKIPIKDTLSEYKSYGGEYYFALSGATSVGIVYSPKAPSMPASIQGNMPAGSLWMATKEANGQWAWNYITIARTNEYPFKTSQEFWQSPADEPALMRSLYGALREVYNPLSSDMSDKERQEAIEKKYAAIKVLNSLVYLGDGNAFRLTFGNDGAVEMQIGGAVTHDTNEAISALKGGEYRFQIEMSDLDDMSRMNDFIDAGILKSEMRSFIRIGANLGVNFLIDQEENGELRMPVPNHAISATRYDNVFAAKRNGISNIRIGNSGYQLLGDGTVKTMATRFSSGDEVTDKEIIAQVKALAEVMEGSDSDYPGSRWVIEKKMPVIRGRGKNKTEEYIASQYTELYERNIDGITVRMQRRGKNGAVMLLNSHDEWNALMEIAKPMANTYAEEAPADEYIDPKKYEDKNERSGGMAAEEMERQKAQEQTKLEEKYKGFAKFKKDLGEGTVQQMQQEDEEEQDEVDCG